MSIIRKSENLLGKVLRILVKSEVIAQNWTSWTLVCRRLMSSIAFVPVSIRTYDSLWKGYYYPWS